MTERRRTPYIKGDPDRRFDAKWVVDPLTGCHLWTAGKQKKGYGQFNAGSGRYISAHQYAWERINGPTPAGQVLDHFVCDTPACCNPAHVRPVTPLENLRRSPRWNGNKTHCPAGHPYSHANTSIRPDGRRQCRACHNARTREKAQ